MMNTKWILHGSRKEMDQKLGIAREQVMFRAATTHQYSLFFLLLINLQIIFLKSLVINRSHLAHLTWDIFRNAHSIVPVLLSDWRSKDMKNKAPYARMQQSLRSTNWEPLILICILYSVTDRTQQGTAVSMATRCPESGLRRKEDHCDSVSLNRINYRW